MRTGQTKRDAKNHVIYVEVGPVRKARLRKAVKLLKRHRDAGMNQKSLVIAAIDRQLSQLARRFPEIDEAV